MQRPCGASPSRDRLRAHSQELVEHERGDISGAVFVLSLLDCSQPYVVLWPLAARSPDGEASCYCTRARGEKAYDARSGSYTQISVGARECKCANRAVLAAHHLAIAIDHRPVIASWALDARSRRGRGGGGDQRFGAMSGCEYSCTPRLVDICLGARNRTAAVQTGDHTTRLPGRQTSRGGGWSWIAAERIYGAW